MFIVPSDFFYFFGAALIVFAGLGPRPGRQELAFSDLILTQAIYRFVGPMTLPHNSYRCSAVNQQTPQARTLSEDE